ncbi:hypothetical protein [Methylophilus sp. DW102]|uniref:hypothetical protein n=1 Tax=Methylophilus sp. DW102 TaxID=3095607 RepID=UPI00308E279A|nr:hypothetical protein MTDW_10530 [Methylophilus sp. DW102]
MNITLDVTVCAVKNDDRVNFNFTSKEISESWCIGPTITSENINPTIGQNIKIYGSWVHDASNKRVFFHATHIDYGA